MKSFTVFMVSMLLGWSSMLCGFDRYDASWSICQVAKEDSALVALKLSKNWQESCRSFQDRKMPLLINDKIWLVGRLPHLIPEHHVLFIPNGWEDLRVYLDGKLFYEYGSFDTGFSHVSTQQWHAIELDQSLAGKSIQIELHFAFSFLGKSLVPELIPYRQVMEDRLWNTMLVILVVGFNVMNCVVFTSVALTSRHGSVFGHFAIVGFCSSLWILVNQHSPVKNYLPFGPSSLAAIDLMSLYIGGYCLYFCSAALLELKGYLHVFVRRTLFLFAIASPFLGVNPWVHIWYSLPIFQCFVLLMVINIFRGGFSQLWSGNIEARVFAFSLFGYCFAVCHDLLQYLGVISTSKTALTFVSTGLVYCGLAVSLTIRYRKEKQAAEFQREALLENVQRLNVDLSHSLDRLDHATKARTAMIKDLAHRGNNPLHALSLSLEDLKLIFSQLKELLFELVGPREQMSEEGLVCVDSFEKSFAEISRNIEEIHLQSKRVSMAVNEIRLLGGVDGKRQDWVSLPVVFDRVYERLQESLGKQCLSMFEVNFHDSHPVLADPLLLVVVLERLFRAILEEKSQKVIFDVSLHSDGDLEFGKICLSMKVESSHVPFLNEDVKLVMESLAYTLEDFGMALRWVDDSSVDIYLRQLAEPSVLASMVA